MVQTRGSRVKSSGIISAQKQSPLTRASVYSCLKTKAKLVMPWLFQRKRKSAYFQIGRIPKENPNIRTLRMGIRVPATHHANYRHFKWLFCAIWNSEERSNHCFLHISRKGRREFTLVSWDIIHCFYKDNMKFFRNFIFHPKLQINTNINIQSKPVRLFILFNQRARWN